MSLGLGVSVHKWPGAGGGGGEKGWEIGEKGDVAGRGAVLWQMLCA